MDNDLSLVESHIHRSARQTAANKIRQVHEIDEHPDNRYFYFIFPFTRINNRFSPIRLDQSWFIKYQRLVIACSISTYLIVIIIVGVLVVYFALNKPTGKIFSYYEEKKPCFPLCCIKIEHVILSSHHPLNDQLHMIHVHIILPRVISIKMGI